MVLGLEYGYCIHLRTVPFMKLIMTCPGFLACFVIAYIEFIESKFITKICHPVIAKEYSPNITVVCSR